MLVMPPESSETAFGAHADLLRWTGRRVLLALEVVW